MRVRVGLGAFLLACFATDLFGATKVLLRVASTPSGALVSVSSSDAKAQAVTVAGVTPIERTLVFPKRGGLTLTLEKRGYAPHQVEITPISGPVDVTLERLAAGEEEIPLHALPRSGTVLVVPPEMEIIKRGFSSEGVDPEASRTAERCLRATVQAALAGGFQARAVELTDETRAPLKSLWRDARTAMQLVDPIRLPYLARPTRLETLSARNAAAALGRGEVPAFLLLLAGKQVRDTAGMKLGQLAVLSAGTACSYGSGYARAMERGDSFFIYNVHVPDFTSGLTLRAALIDAATGEVLWVNRGNWSSIRFDRPEAVKNVVEELLAGLL